MIRAVIPDPLTYKGNINPTTEDSGADAIPTGSVGDSYTCSWGGTKVEGNLDNSLDWLSAIKGSDTTATLGDLLIINSGDGSGANEWTLVKTGTVDSGASIDVGDGTTSSFPPNSPQKAMFGTTSMTAEPTSISPTAVATRCGLIFRPGQPDAVEERQRGTSSRRPAPTTRRSRSWRWNVNRWHDHRGWQTPSVVVSTAVGDGLEINSGAASQARFIWHWRQPSDGY